MSNVIIVEWKTKAATRKASNRRKSQLLLEDLKTGR